MSEPPSCHRDTASASPESPEEGDFSPRQLCDNPKSLEEQETCEDHKEPIVNIIPDSYSSSPLNTQICAQLVTNDLGKLCAGELLQEQPIKKSSRREPTCFNTSPMTLKPLVSPEFMEVPALDGRFITLVSTQTQTDWEWVEQSLSFSCQVQKETEDPQLLQTEVVSVVTDPDSSQVACSWQNVCFIRSQERKDEKMPKKKFDMPCVGPPRLIAYKPEPKQTPHDEKAPEVESKHVVHLAQCDYCQQLCQPFIHSELLESETDFERLFCCEPAKRILEEKEKLVQKDSDRKTDANIHASIMSEEEKEAAKAQAWERLRQLQLQRNPQKDSLSEDLRCFEIKQKTCRLSKEIPYISDEPHIFKIAIKDITDIFTLRDNSDSEAKVCTVLMILNRQSYPSGKAAIVIASTEAADFTYLILEDKDVAPSIKGIFTNRGHSTCDHPNGMIWLNLTPVGGLRLSETGALRRRWNWLYFDPHEHSLPFKPLTFALGPQISVRIHSKEHMYITFAHQTNSVRFSVGSKLKELIYPESHNKLGQDNLERYVLLCAWSDADLYVQPLRFHNQDAAAEQTNGKREVTPPKNMKAHGN